MGYAFSTGVLLEQGESPKISRMPSAIVMRLVY